MSKAEAAAIMAAHTRKANEIERLNEQIAERDAEIADSRSARKPQLAKGTALCCSFCGKEQNEVRNLIAGPEAIFICNECVDLCVDIIRVTWEIEAKKAETAAAEPESPPPEQPAEPDSPSPEAPKKRRRPKGAKGKPKA